MFFFVNSRFIAAAFLFDRVRRPYRRADTDIKRSICLCHTQKRQLAAALYTKSSPEKINGRARYFYRCLVKNRRIEHDHTTVDCRFATTGYIESAEQSRTAEHF